MDYMRMQLIPLFASILLHSIGIHGSIEAIHPGRIMRRVTSHTTPDEPTQTGTISTCNLWYDVVSGDSCASVEAAFGITSAQFLAWNPAVSSDCVSNFWVGDSYCVGVGSGSSSHPTTTTSSSTRTAETTGHDEPTQSGQPENCDAWYDVVSGDTCALVEAAFGITSAQFLAWNPSVSSDCSSGFFAGFSYCVGVNTNATSAVTSVTSSIATTSSVKGTYSIIASGTSAVLVPIPTATGFPPTPTQSGIISGCIRYYQANTGDTCQAIVNRYSNLITMNEFLAWNPSVGGMNCTGLYVNWYYCVDGPMDQSDLANATTQYLPGWTPVSIPQMNSTFDPYPTATGLISTCQSYYEANQGDTCTSVASTLGYLDVNEFEEWNVGVNCASLTAATYYCVANFTSLPLPSTVSTLPSPVQSGIVSSCTSWYQATIGDDCSLIPQYFQTFTEAELLSWNPALGSDCSGLVYGDYYCVAIPGTPTSPTTTASLSYATTTSSSQTISTGTSSFSSTTRTTSSSLPPTTTSAASSLATPTPVQTGMVSGCERFYLVESGDGCYAIATDANIALADFYSWNPAVGSSCVTLAAGVYVCIGITGRPTTITAGTPVPATPSPTQTGMVSGCVRFYNVESGDGCYNIAADAGIALSDFYSWNPAIGSSCQGLQANVYVCIGISGQGTTITSGTPVAAPTTTS